MLSDFYRSKEWTELIRILRLERETDEGIICAHCGLPIIRKYDCIGHHVTALTEENYTDPQISLNPDNIVLIHHKCHNIIHDRLGFYGKKVYLVHGSPLSGKSSWVKSSMAKGDLLIDMDMLWYAVSGQAMYDKPERLKGTVFAMRDMLIDRVRTRCGNFKSAYVVGGFPLISERERLAKRLGAEPIHIDTSKEECLQRLANDENRDRELWEKFIDEYWERYTE